MSIISLAIAEIGKRFKLVELCCEGGNNRLRGMGFLPGIELEIVSKTSDGSVVVALQDQRLGLGADLAHQILVAPVNTVLKKVFTKDEQIMDRPTAKLRDCSVGSVVKVVSYEPTGRAYKRKLLAMGLTPGTEFKITRHAPLGDPTEIEVRGFHLSLRKDEADALLIEPLG
jgi:ferrous iron transport protein A